MGGIAESTYQRLLSLEMDTTLLQQVLSLPESERKQLADQIYESISLTAEHHADLERRQERIDRGEASFFSWEEVKAELLRRRA